jgi:hypothetical protein
MQTTATYYVRRKGRIDGPWSVEKLRSEIALRKLGRHHEISTDGLQWSPAGSFESLFFAKETPSNDGEMLLDLGDETVNSSQIETERRADYDRPVARSGVSTRSTAGVKKQWYYYCDGERHGPTGLEELLDAAHAGRLTSDALVWREGMPDWLPAEQITELSGIVRDQGVLSDDARESSSSSAANESHTIGGAMIIRRWEIGIAAVATGIAALASTIISGLGVIGIVPIVLGIVGLRRIRRGHGSRVNATYARLGIALGLIAVVIGASQLVYKTIFGG